MPHLRIPGTARRAGAACAAAALITLGTAAAPAHAAEKSHFSILPPGPQTLLPQSAGGAAAAFRTLSVTVQNEGPAAMLGHVRLTVDASRLKGVAELSLPKECGFTPGDPSHLHAVCELGTIGSFDSAGRFNPAGTVDLGVRSLAGAAVGAAGSIDFTASADNATEDPDDALFGTTTPVTVGHGPDLAVGRLGDLSVTPGTTAPQPLTVGNKGDRDAKGLELYLDAGELTGGAGVSLTGSYGNCQYHYGDPSDPVAQRTAVLCSFPDVTVHPGQTFQLSEPVGLVTTATATKGYFEYGFDQTGGLFSDPGARGVRGTGHVLGLVPVPPSAPAARKLVQDIDYSNNVSSSMIDTGRTFDVAVTAADVSGTIGRPLGFRATVTNVGTEPTTPMPGAPAADITAAVLVALPSGVGVGTLPKDCFSADDPAMAGSASFRAAAGMRSAAAPPPAESGYLCVVRKVLRAGDSASFDFTLTPTKALDRAQGVAMAAAGDGPDDDYLNNLVAFRVSAAKAPATATPAPKPTPKPTGTAAATGGAAPTASGTAPGGGNLADTGGGSSALPVALGGGVAVLLGAGALLLARRRAGSHG